MPDVESQGLEGGLETSLAQAHGPKAAGHVAGLADGLVQQAGDLGRGIGRGDLALDG